MNALQVLDASIHTLDIREDVTNLAKCFDLQGLQYLEIQAVQNFQSAMAHWPLLMETHQPSLSVTRRLSIRFQPISHKAEADPHGIEKSSTVDTSAGIASSGYLFRRR